MVYIFADECPKRTDKAMVYTAPYQERTTVEYALIANMARVIRVVFDDEITSLVIRPLSYNIAYKIIDKHTVEIYPDRMCNLSLEPDGDLNRAVLIFYGMAEPADRKKYDNIIRFEQGRHYADVISVTEDNTLLYLEEGAVVDGRIEAVGCNNLAIDGLGTLTYDCYDNVRRFVFIDKCTDVSVKNIVLKGSTNWNLTILNCDNVHIDNVKIIGHKGNSDGIDICSSRNVLTENCFTRVWDDSLVVKARTIDKPEDPFAPDVYDIVFQNCVLWNDMARPMEVGVEIRTDKMSGITFRNIDVIHSVTSYPIMGIHHGDRAEVCDVTFANINVEQTPGAQPFDIRVIPSAWNKDDKTGFVHDIYFKNINFLSDDNTRLPYHSRISGYSEESSVYNVFFENIKFNGKVASTADDLGLQIFDHVQGVSVISDGGPCIEKVRTRIISDSFKLKDDGYYDVNVRVVLENTTDMIKEGSLRLDVNPLKTRDYDGYIEYRLNGHQSITVVKTMRLPAGKYALSLYSDCPDLEGSIEFLNLPLVVGEEYGATYFFEDSYGNSHDEKVQFAVKNNVLMIKSDLIKRYDLILYVAKKVMINPGDMLFSTEDTNYGKAPAILLGKDGEYVEGPQIGCPEEISFVFKNYPKTDIKMIRIPRKTVNTAYIPLNLYGIDSAEEDFLMELVINDDISKRYEFTLFSSPIPRYSAIDPRVMAHMFVEVVVSK